jgi:phage-related protein
MAIVGVASVRIKPDLTEFRKELNAGLKAIKAEVRVAVHADTKPAQAEIAAFRKRNDGKDLTQNLVVKTDKTETALRGLVKKIDFKGAFDGLNNGLSSATSKMLTFAKAGAAFAVVQSAASTLGPALVSAAGAAALIPAALVGGVGILAAMKLGADGIKKSFEGLTPTIDNLKTQVSGAIQKGLVPGVNNLKTFLPQISKGLQDIGFAAGQAFTRVTAMLNTGGNAAKVNGIFQQMARVVQNLGAAFAPVVQAFINIGAIGAPILTQLTSGLGGVAQKFAAWTASAEGAAAIKDTITGAIEAFKLLGQILQQVVGIATNVFSGLSSGAGGLSGTLLPVLTAVNQALGSEGMQKALGGIGNALATVGQAVGSTLGPVVQTVLPLLAQALQAAAPGISALVQGFGELIKGVAPALPAIGQLASVLGQGLGTVAKALGPVLGQLATVLAGTLAEAIPPLVPIITQLVTAVGQILTAVAPLIGPLVQLAAAALQPILAIIQALIPPFQQLIQSVLKAIQPLIPPLSQAFTSLGQALAPLAGALGNALVQIFTAIAPILPPLVNVVVALVNAFLPLVPVVTSVINIVTPIIALVAQVAAAFISFQLSALEPIIKVFGVVATVVGTSMSSINNAIAGVISKVTGIFSGFLSTVTSTWSNITGSIGRAVDNVKNAISNGFSAAVDFVRGIPGKILGALGDFGSLLFNAGRSIIQGLINGIKSAVGAVKDAVSGVLSAARNLLPFSPAKEGPFSGKGWTLYSGRSISEALAQGIRERGGQPVTEMSKVMEGVQGALTGNTAFGASLNASVQQSVSTQAAFNPVPVNIFVSGDEGAMKDFINVQVDESNRGVRRRVKAGTGGTA